MQVSILHLLKNSVSRNIELLFLQTIFKFKKHKLQFFPVEEAVTSQLRFLNPLFFSFMFIFCQAHAGFVGHGMLTAAVCGNGTTKRNNQPSKI